MRAAVPGNAVLSKRESSFGQWVIGLLTVVVVLMMVAVGIALVFAMRQANASSKPQAYADLWYLYSIDSELLRLHATADKVLRKEASGSDLLDRVEIVLSIVAPNASAPLSETPVIDQMPDVRKDLAAI